MGELPPPPDKRPNPEVPAVVGRLKLNVLVVACGVMLTVPEVAPLSDNTPVAPEAPTETLSVVVDGDNTPAFRDQYEVAPAPQVQTLLWHVAIHPVLIRYPCTTSVHADPNPPGGDAGMITCDVGCAKHNAENTSALINARNNGHLLSALHEHIPLIQVVEIADLRDWRQEERTAGRNLPAARTRDAARSDPRRRAGHGHGLHRYPFGECDPEN